MVRRPSTTTTWEYSTCPCTIRVESASGCRLWRGMDISSFRLDSTRPPSYSTRRGTQALLSSASISSNAFRLWERVRARVLWEEVMMAALLAVGSQAPDFRLPATTGDTVSLSHYRGKRNLILVFYVGDHTPDCNRQLTSLQEEMETLEACNAAVLGINPGTLDDHQRYQAQLVLTFPL